MSVQKKNLQMKIEYDALHDYCESVINRVNWNSYLLVMHYWYI